MSASVHTHRVSVRDIVKRKGGTPIVCLTAYTAPVAKILDRHVDLLLVGDSLGMVIYGMDNTKGVTVPMMINHGAAVVRATTQACIVVDLPFGSYESSPQAAFETASRVLADTGCTAVKLEGGVVMAETVRFLVDHGIPVMGHVGLQPQSVKASGGYRVHGRSEQEADRIRADSHAIADAGAFSIVLENIVEPLGRSLTGELAVPTIGIGASPACDGQILVTDDMVGGFTDFTPRFVKRFADVAGEIDRAAKAFASDVAARRFPAPEHCSGVEQTKGRAA
ncbi:MAG: 3-methyl-2-oxobutanoate hydroxymethyltransferase [Alphaproteobacteria bacterium]